MQLLMVVGSLVVAVAVPSADASVLHRRIPTTGSA
jgi:hypothetical protein